MNKSKRSPIIAGNWKMNMTPDKTEALINEMRPILANASCEVALCVPYIDLHTAISTAKGSNILIGAQNCHWAKNGAFTGEISAEMLTAIGCNLAIVGHSERREYFGDTSETVNKRLLAGLAEGIRMILCIGETLTEREGNITETVIREQLTKGLVDVSAEMVKNVVLAYEPVWAIGTGKTATSAQAQEVCCFIRGLLTEIYGEDIAQSLQIQYGGSMNGSNADELLSQPDIDGGLIGGASLKAEDFSKIIVAASK